MATNLPSVYGGTKVEPWFKNRRTRALDPTLVPDDRLSTQSYSDDRLELMGQNSLFRLVLNEFKRIAQLRTAFQINLKRDESNREFFLTVDGENYAMIQPSKVTVKLHPSAPFLNIIRGPLPYLRT